METLTLLALVVLESLEAGESSASSDHLMAQAGLVVVKVVVFVYLLVAIFVFVCTMKVRVRISSTIRIGNVPQKPIVKM